MSPFALLSLLRGRGSLYALLGALLLSTLWVTSLTLISSRPNATELLTDAGSQILQPFLTKQGFGLTPEVYGSLEAQASQHPSQPVALPSLLKAQVLGREIANRNYNSGVRVIYGDVANAYYGGGLSAAFTIPPELQQILPSFGVFGAATGAAAQPATDQLPSFLQPLFTVIGLTPATFTAQGHQNLLDLLPWFWLATILLGGTAALLNRSGSKLSGLAKTVVHSAWPIVLLLAGLWVASLVYATTFAPYKDSLGVVERSFLPAYGAALGLGIVALIVLRLLAARQPQAPGEPVMAGVPAGLPRAALSDAPSVPPAPSAPPPLASDAPLFGQLPESPPDQNDEQP